MWREICSKMGTGSSKNPDSSSHGSSEDREDHGGGQLYVSLKMEKYKPKGELIPHVYGSVPLIGSWDSSKAVIDSSRFCSFTDCCFFCVR